MSAGGKSFKVALVQNCAEREMSPSLAEVERLVRGAAKDGADLIMLTEMVEGRPLDEVKAISREDLLEELGVPISPARMKCAMLGLKVLKAGIYGVPPADDTL